MLSGFAKKAIIINIVLALVFIISGELEMALISDQAVSFGVFFIEHQPLGNPPPPTVTPPYLNLFTVFLIVFLLVNAYFLFKLNKLKSDENVK